MKLKIILVVAILSGLGAFALTHFYLKAERAKIYAGAERVQVLAAAADLPAGTVVRTEDLGTKTAFKAYISSETVKVEELSDIIGKRMLRPIRRSELLTWSHIGVTEQMRTGLAPTIRTGMRAISLSIGGEAAVSGLVQPNDRVDILGTFSFPSPTQAAQVETVTLTVLQDVTVLATGQRLAKGGSVADDGRSFGYSTVTFEVTPREAELLVFAQNMRGQLTLSLRHPEDVSFERALPEVNFRFLEQSLPEINLKRQREIRNKSEL